MDSNVALTIAIVCFVPIAVSYYRWATGQGLHAIPTIGPSAPGFSYIGAFSMLKHAKEMLHEGYLKYKGDIFKIPLIDRWLVVVSGPELIEELRKMPDDKMSFIEAATDLVQSRYTFGGEINRDPYHVDIIRSQLTRRIANFFPAIHNEIIAAFGDMIPLQDEWASVPALHVMRKVVARVSNRVFVGLPMCRNAEYLNMAIFHTMDVMKTRNYLSLVPQPLKPIFAPLVNSSQRTMRQCKRLLGPMIEERFRLLREHGQDWSEKPDDGLQWIVDEAFIRGNGVEDVVRRLLLMNFAAIHTSSNSFTHALYHLAANPEYILPIREEIEAITTQDGWTKAAMNKLRKLDSLMKESQRLNGINATSVMRKAKQDLTLSNGTFIPEGTICVAEALSTHTDENNYTNPDVFDPFRFSDMREEDGEGTKHQFVSTSTDYIPFGHGRHACPGRFFAANELKAMMAHILVSYDVMFENKGVRPPNEGFGTAIIPSPTARVLFRKRKA
ncbi:hypothetical protein NLI96_g2934 [Meripilus lineatus]|uniref:Cytochrome P450 n=1 Tax=Meripilus lineatus TaxID=2056292 RepID=A0AAD5YJK2_9APHY|nr:hypothetical protein NLI96_g2934 [Physisporinus lineatus]